MKKYLILFAILHIQGCLNGADDASTTTTPSVTQSELVGSWVEGCDYNSVTGKYLQNKRVYTDTHVTVTENIHLIPSCSDAVDSVLTTINYTYTVGADVITYSGLSAKEIDYTSLTPGPTFDTTWYSIYKIDELGRLYIGMASSSFDVGSSEVRRNNELDPDYFVKQ